MISNMSLHTQSERWQPDFESSREHCPCATTTVNANSHEEHLILLFKYGRVTSWASSCACLYFSSPDEGLESLSEATSVLRLRRSNVHSNSLEDFLCDEVGQRAKQHDFEQAHTFPGTSSVPSPGHGSFVGKWLTRPRIATESSARTVIGGEHDVRFEG